ncbi:hypothetical protein HYS85_01350 [Candidatus Saccharibacteria bacterium]|nr:hypothetical protein [Candidatus Saccharibacteria bacterium]
MKRKPLLIVTGIAFALLLVLAIFLILKDSQPRFPAIEAEGPGTVIIDNTDELSSILLGRQYQTTSDFVVEYIQQKIDKKIEHAEIVGKPVVNDDGSVDFQIKTNDPETEFTIHIDRSSVKYLTLEVQNTDYRQTIKIY